MNFYNFEGEISIWTFYNGAYSVRIHCYAVPNAKGRVHTKPLNVLMYFFLYEPRLVLVMREVVLYDHIMCCRHYRVMRDLLCSASEGCCLQKVQVCAKLIHFVHRLFFQQKGQGIQSVEPLKALYAPPPPWQTCSDTNSAYLGSILAMQQ